MFHKYAYDGLDITQCFRMTPTRQRKEPGSDVPSKIMAGRLAGPEYSRNEPKKSCFQTNSFSNEMANHLSERRES